MSKDAKLLNAQPTLAVADVDAAFAFYEKLGFVVYTQNHDLHMVINRDSIYLHLATQLVTGTSGCQIMVSDVEALHAQAQAAGLPMKFDIQDQVWGCRDFTLEDPDGNFVTFSEFQRDPSRYLP
jgi:uncharacterized glyoxalase superfamily protein PhnB